MVEQLVRRAERAGFKAIALNEDTYRRTADGWRIASRRISPLTPPEMDGFDA